MKAASASRRERDYRVLSLVLVFALTALIVFVVQLVPGRGAGSSATFTDSAIVTENDAMAVKGIRMTFPATPESELSEMDEGAYDALPDPRAKPKEHERAMREMEMRRRLREARAFLKQKRYGEAVPELSRAIALLPDRSEPFVEMGYAQLGLGNLDHAERAFQYSIERQPTEERAYYGLGLVYERQGDLEAALGAMRSFLHVTETDDKYDPRVTQVRSALWEWEARLGRGFWGETGGVPPGLTEQDLFRDGTGVGMLAPQADGTSKAMVRSPEAMSPEIGRVGTPSEYLFPDPK